MLRLGSIHSPSVATCVVDLVVATHWTILSHFEPYVILSTNLLSRYIIIY